MPMVMLPMIRKISARFRAFDARTGKFLWEKGKNSCVLIKDARRFMLWQLMGYGEDYNRTWEHGSPRHSHGKRAQPFCQIAVGDGEENLDNTKNDLVHPIMKKGATYGSTAKNGEDYAPGQAQMQEAVQIQKTSDTEISVAMFFTFGSEDCNDAWIKEWGLFCLELNDDEGTDDLYRRYLNRNHLIEADWIHKTSTIRLRVVVQIELTYNSPTPWP